MATLKLRIAEIQIGRFGWPAQKRGNHEPVQCYVFHVFGRNINLYTYVLRKEERYVCFYIINKEKPQYPRKTLQLTSRLRSRALFHAHVGN